MTLYITCVLVAEMAIFIHKLDISFAALSRKMYNIAHEKVH